MGQRREDDEVRDCTYGLGCIAEARPQKVSNRVADLSDVPSLENVSFRALKSEDGIWC
jgi:DNA-binding transcriptional regulator of glucitol operon